MKNNKALVNILDDLRELNGLIHENHHKMAEEAGLSLEQYHLLLHLERINSCRDKKLPTIGQLAEKVNNAQNTMSEKISRLEKKQLVKRVRDDKDRRIIRISLSNEGSKMLEEIHNKAKQEALFKALSDMDQKLVTSFSEGLKGIITNLKQQ